MIEKIDHSDIVPKEHLIGKLNELIDEHNRLIERYEAHYHTTLDTRYNTTGPKAGGPHEIPYD